jgi:hypothetical protein
MYDMNFDDDSEDWSDVTSLLDYMNDIEVEYNWRTEEYRHREVRRYGGPGGNSDVTLFMSEWSYGSGE